MFGKSAPAAPPATANTPFPGKPWIWRAEFFGAYPQVDLAPLAKAKVPLFLLCGDADDVVPYPENGAIVKERYEKLGGPVRVLIKKGLGHHPHGLDDPTPVVEYILKHTGSLPKPEACRL